VCHSVSIFRFDLLHRRKCTLTQGSASKHRVHLSAKSFSLGNLSLLNKFPMLSVVSKSVNIAHFYYKMLCLFLLNYLLQGWEINLAWGLLCECRVFSDRQTEFFGGTEFNVLNVLFKTTRRGTKKHRDYPERCPCWRLAAGRTLILSQNK